MKQLFPIFSICQFPRVQSSEWCEATYSQFSITPTIITVISNNNMNSWTAFHYFPDRTWIENQMIYLKSKQYKKHILNSLHSIVYFQILSKLTGETVLCSLMELRYESFCNFPASAHHSSRSRWAYSSSQNYHLLILCDRLDDANVSKQNLWFNHCQNQGVFRYFKI